MSVLQIFLLGKLHVQRDEQTVAGFDTRKVQELFCYLLLYRDRPHPREALADLLWPKSTTAQSLKYLRQALWQLQTALGSAGAADAASVILADSEWVRLNPKADFWLDVAEFERGCAQVHGIPGGELDKQGVQRVQEALKLYRGDLLQGWYQDWCLFERERLQRLYLGLLEKRIAFCEAHGQYETGLECGNCALRYDVAHERTHRRLMRLHYLAGDRTAALRQYERCVNILRQELNVAPSKRTLALYERIRSDHPLSSNGTTPQNKGKAPGEISPPLDQVLHHLQRLQTAFAQTQRQLQDVIQAIEAGLTGRD
jgi:DNA-binding SARP family transcriptional activator